MPYVLRHCDVTGRSLELYCALSRIFVIVGYPSLTPTSPHSPHPTTTTTELLVPICYFMLEGRKDPAKVGLMYLCTFTLLKLSGELRKFQL